jgi:hypothetical protein
MNAETPTLPAVRELRAQVTIGARPEAMVPTTLESVWRLSELVAASGMAPKDMKQPEQIAVAILHGMEVGMTPMTALQSIAVVNGRPSVWGDGAIGLVRASGQLEEFEEGLNGEGDKRVAFCRVKRRGEKTLERTFSWDDAKKAGLTSKTGPWQNYPNRMLVLRARAFTLRDAFADILRGLSIREEQEDVERTLHDVTPPRPTPIEPLAAPTVIKGTATRAALAQEPVHSDPSHGADRQEDVGASLPSSAPTSSPPIPPADEPTVDFDRVYDEIKDLLATVREIADIADVGSQFTDEYNLMTRSQRSVVDGLFQDAERQLRQRTEEEGRKRVEAAGGKGIKQYMDEDRQDATQAAEIEQQGNDSGARTVTRRTRATSGDAPSSSQPETSGSEAPDDRNPLDSSSYADLDDETLAKLLRDAMVRVNSKETAQAFYDVMKNTKQRRRAIADESLRNALFGEATTLLDKWDI